MKNGRKIRLEIDYSVPNAIEASRDFLALAVTWLEEDPGLEEATPAIKKYIKNLRDIRGRLNKALVNMKDATEE